MENRSWLQHKVETLHEITQAINMNLNQEEVLDVVLRRICTELGYKAATLRLLNEERQQLELAASFGLSRSYLEKGAVEVARSGVDMGALAGQHITLADVRQDAGFQYKEAADREGLRSMLAVPINLQERVIGTLHVYTGEPHEFTSEEKSWVATAANLGAQGIRRAHCFAAFRRVARNINSSLELKDVLTTLLLESVKELNVKAGSIRLLGPKRRMLHLAAAYGLSETYLKKGDVEVSNSPIDQHVLEESRPITITDVTQEHGFQYPEEAKREGIRSVLVLPLSLRQTMVGVMRLYSAQVRRFCADETSFAVALADLGAVAIENARLHQALKQRFEALKEDADGWYRFLSLG